MYQPFLRNPPRKKLEIRRYRTDLKKQIPPLDLPIISIGHLKQQVIFPENCGPGSARLVEAAIFPNSWLTDEARRIKC
jgi:hypothetical protein